MGFLDGIGGAIVGGVGGLLGGAVQNQANAKEAALNRDFQHEEAQNQMTFQEKMSSTAHQRETKDLLKAGLNPILSANGGASAPSGAAGSGAQAQMGDTIGKGVSSALEVRRLGRELKQSDSQLALNDTIMDTQRAQTELAKSNAKKANVETATTAAYLPQVVAESQNAMQRAKINSGKGVAEFDVILDKVGSVLGTANSAKQLLTPKFSDTLRPGQGIFNTKTGEVLRERHK
jgi:hypothetical protein